MKNQFDNKIVLITGGSGSWGNELIKQLLETNVKEIRSFARGEFNQVSLQRKFNDSRLKTIIGDVRDYGEIKHACKDVNIVFHLAAIKHVPICERQPYEAIKTNINGTRNIIRASIENEVEKVIDVSSDKATLPINTYGMTKSVGEKLTLNASTLGSKTKFMCVRSGNVLGTAGSVVPFWIDQIKRFNKISITDERMTRYFLTLEEAIKLLFVATKSNIDSGLFVMKMPACRIVDLADVLIEHYGDKNTEKEIIGIRAGERIDEILVSKSEIPNAFEYDNSYYLIINDPTSEITSLCNRVDFKEYTSKDKLMTKKEIEFLLEKGGYLK